MKRKENKWKGKRIEKKVGDLIKTKKNNWRIRRINENEGE